MVLTTNGINRLLLVITRILFTLIIDLFSTQVRLWRAARSQAQIICNMRATTGLDGHADLLAWWKFDDPGMCVISPLPPLSFLFRL